MLCQHAELRPGADDPSLRSVFVCSELERRGAGCDGVIASGAETRAIKKLTQDKLLIVTPGIRPAEYREDDQKRRMTAEQAIKAGADYLVIGRPIRDADDPRTKALEFIEEMEGAFRLRGLLHG